VTKTTIKYSLLLLIVASLSYSYPTILIGKFQPSNFAVCLNLSNYFIHLESSLPLALKNILSFKTKNQLYFFCVVGTPSPFSQCIKGKWGGRRARGEQLSNLPTKHLTDAGVAVEGGRSGHRRILFEGVFRTVSLIASQSFSTRGGFLGRQMGKWVKWHCSAGAR